ncbi:hypothetical protein JGY90_10205 [Staphylococcus xylosus]|uniref:hypothetical protein n=1 Tax=Staphylococcus xylosus TaxID=1288 RepID=UPI001CDBA3D4|nr:hypothetical protein [Staphylococcus xylosus]UBV34076.1 hypothetical protein JGY90_10205 [Staphylococcus xylosus]
MKKLLLAATLLLTVFLSGCTWLDDAKKDHESDTKGLERTVTVYSKTGDVVKQYKVDNVRTKYNDGGALVVNIDSSNEQRCCD